MVTGEAIYPRPVSIYLDPLEGLTIALLVALTALLVFNMHTFRILRREIKALRAS